MRSFGSDEPLYDSPEVNRGNPWRVFGRLVPARPGILAAVHDVYTASRVDGGKMPDLPSVLAMPSSRLVGIARQAAYEWGKLGPGVASWHRTKEHCSGFVQSTNSVSGGACRRGGAYLSVHRVSTSDGGSLRSPNLRTLGLSP